MLKCLYIVDSFTLEWFVLDEQIDGGNKQEWWDWEDSTQGSKHLTHDQIPKGGAKAEFPHRPYTLFYQQ